MGTYFLHIVELLYQVLSVHTFSNTDGSVVITPYSVFRSTASCGAIWRGKKEKVA